VCGRSRGCAFQVSLIEQAVNREVRETVLNLLGFETVALVSNV
jgi:hypothetical protein